MDGRDFGHRNALYIKHQGRTAVRIISAVNEITVLNSVLVVEGAFAMTKSYKCTDFSGRGVKPMGRKGSGLIGFLKEMTYVCGNVLDDFCDKGLRGVCAGMWDIPTGACIARIDNVLLPGQLLRHTETPARSRNTKPIEPLHSVGLSLRVRPRSPFAVSSAKHNLRTILLTCRSGPARKPQRFPRRLLPCRCLIL